MQERLEQQEHWLSLVTVHCWRAGPCSAKRNEQGAAKWPLPPHTGGGAQGTWCACTIARDNSRAAADIDGMNSVLHWMITHSKWQLVNFSCSAVPPPIPEPTWTLDAGPLLLILTGSPRRQSFAVACSHLDSRLPPPGSPGEPSPRPPTGCAFPTSGALRWPWIWFAQ